MTCCMVMNLHGTHSMVVVMVQAQGNGVLPQSGAEVSAAHRWHPGEYTNKASSPERYSTTRASCCSCKESWWHCQAGGPHGGQAHSAAAFMSSS
jgi:hypothetical protein